MFTELEKTIAELPIHDIPEERLSPIKALSEFVYHKLQQGKPVHLNFICTHNSRRSQYSQVWASTLANYFGIDLHGYSGGVEVTEFNKRAVDALERDGFQIQVTGDVNPVYSIFFGKGSNPIVAYSKMYEDSSNPKENFAAVMTCDHADENCPFIPGAEQRIPLRFDDPKAYDGTALESMKYSERSHQIAAELFLAFKLATDKLEK
jgi:arsenate reductase (thioredoxin)